MSDLSAMIGVVVLVITCFSAAYVITRMVLEHRRDKSHWKFEDQAKPEKPKKADMVQVFCVDCGKALQSLRVQQGFDGVSGTPRYSYFRKCVSAANGLVDCGARPKSTSLVPGMHNHDDVTDTVVTCPACLDVMVQNGLSADEAAKLYASAGVIFDRSQDPMHARFLQYGFGSGSYNPRTGRP